jgi:hypothetical protein
VSDSNGTADFFQGPAEIRFSSGLSETQMRRHNRVRRTRVQTVALDEFLEEHRIGPVGLVKVDVEGSEAEVLGGMAQRLKRDRPSILCEVLPGDHRGEALERILRPCGYRFMHLTPDGPRERERIVGHPVWLNYLFTDLDQREAAILAAAHCHP